MIPQSVKLAVPLGTEITALVSVNTASTNSNARSSRSARVKGEGGEVARRKARPRCRPRDLARASSLSVALSLLSLPLGLPYHIICPDHYLCHLVDLSSSISQVFMMPYDALLLSYVGLPHVTLSLLPCVTCDLVSPSLPNALTMPYICPISYAFIITLRFMGHNHLMLHDYYLASHVSYDAGVLSYVSCVI